MQRPKTFLKTMLYTSFVPNIILVFITKLISIISEKHSKLYQTLYFGQTSQIFCLSTILNLKYLSRMNTQTQFYGIIVPTSWSIWLELILNQMMNPTVPIVAHISGVFAGLLYVYIPSHLNLSSLSLWSSSGNGNSGGYGDIINGMNTFWFDMQSKFTREYHRLQSCIIQWLDGYNSNNNMFTMHRPSQRGVGGPYNRSHFGTTGGGREISVQEMRQRRLERFMLN